MQFLKCCKVTAHFRLSLKIISVYCSFAGYSFPLLSFCPTEICRFNLQHIIRVFWSDLMCSFLFVQAFELATGDYLFEPHSGEDYSRDEGLFVCFFLFKVRLQIQWLPLQNEPCLKNQHCKNSLQKDYLMSSNCAQGSAVKHCSEFHVLVLVFCIPLAAGFSTLCLKLIVPQIAHICLPLVFVAA